MVQRVVDRVEGGAGVVVVDAVRLGPAASPRFQFKVATVEQAEILIRGRGKALAGSGIVLSEILTAAESQLHKRLYPDFLRLKEAGHRVQFRRARLFVDGQLWSKPAGPARVAAPLSHAPSFSLLPPHLERRHWLTPPPRGAAG